MKFTAAFVAAFALQVAAADRNMHANPGAGIVGMDKFKPYQNLHKDSFSPADCVQDYMYYHGDKFGNNRHGYKLEESHNVSIVLYEDHVIKMDRKPMTPTVCFQFCRTVPNMGFFGIVSGRRCYCTPYYQPQPSDDSICDSPCDGDKNLMCGGPAKSQVFSLHTCADTEEDLMRQCGAGEELAEKMGGAAKYVNGLNDHAMELVNQAKSDFKIAPDPAITYMLQDAAVFTAKFDKAGKDVGRESDKLMELLDKCHQKRDFQNPNHVTKAEELTADLEKEIEISEGILKTLVGIVDPDAEPPKEHTDKLYYPVMHFVDQAYDEVPQTCDGDKLAKPWFVHTEAECAAHCDIQFTECAGYQRLGEFCFLFKKITGITYYAGCKKEKEPEFVEGKVLEEPKKKKSFLQVEKKFTEYQAMCKVRFADFNGISFKPDKLGKNSYAVKDLFKSPKCIF